MRKNIPPIREPVFDAVVEVPQKNGLPPLRLPLKFLKTNRPWAEFFANLSTQANTGAEAEIAEDLFAGISPLPSGRNLSEQDLFGGLSSSGASRAVTGEDPFAAPLPASPRLDSLARYFLLMGA